MSDIALRPLFVAEPPATWLRREPVVVDCSVLAALLWSEPAAEQAAAQLRGKALHAPDLLAYELANVGRSKCRAGMPPVDVLAGLAAYAEQRIVLHPVEPQAMFALAERHALTAYDAAYLALAGALNAPLVTFDRRLGDAAARHIGAGPPLPDN